MKIRITRILFPIFQVVNFHVVALIYDGRTLSKRMFTCFICKLSGTSLKKFFKMIVFIDNHPLQ